MKALIVGDGKKKEIRKAAVESESWLAGMVDSLECDLDGKLDLGAINADFALVFGGDGFILSVARRLGDNRIPVLGVNFGKIGFIAEFSYDETRKAVKEFIDGRFSLSERLMLDVTVRNKGRVAKHRALNDIVLHRGSDPRMILVNISIDGHEVISYTGDGLIVSTPTGSTAHCAAAGGAILMPETEAIELSWICPQSMTTRPLVIPSKSCIELGLASRSAGWTLAIDGQITMNLEENACIKICGAPGNFRMVRSMDRTYFDILRQKLNFGGLPGYKERFHRTDFGREAE